MSQIRFLHYVYNPFNAFCKNFERDVKLNQKKLDDLKIQILRTESRQNPFCVSFYNNQTSPSFTKYEWDDKSIKEVLDFVEQEIKSKFNKKQDNDQEEKQKQDGGSIDYKHKYLKYKAKYLQAQNMN